MGPGNPPPPGALIQYFGPPRTYPTVSYYQALDPDAFLAPGRFKDQVVLVGLSLQTAATIDAGHFGRRPLLRFEENPYVRCPILGPPWRRH